MINKLVRKSRTLLNIIENPILYKADRKNLKAQFIKDFILIDDHVTGSIKTILDVGAADGKYAKAARFFFPHAHIYAFEPIPDSFEKLTTFFKNDSKTKIFNFALGAINEQTDFHVNDFSFSSSLLEMTETHKQMFPHTKGERTLKIDVKKLDSLKDIEIVNPSLLKIDVQGYELEVLKGAGELLDRFDVVQLEINFESFYDKQANYAALFNFMYEHNFKKFLQSDTMYSDENILLACDIVFLK